MNPIVFVLVDWWLDEALLASMEMWNCAAEASEPPSPQLMRELVAHLEAATERLEFWRSLWVAT